MATSGILNTTAWKGKNGTRFLELKWERTAINVVEQTSTIKWTLTSRGTYTGYVMSAPFRVIIDGEQVYYSESRIKLYTNRQVATGTKTIKHNTDGTRTFAASVSAALYYSSINATGSDTFTLDLVGMASITKAPNFNDEENPTIEYYNPVGDAITSLQAAISLTGETPDIEYREIPIASGSYTFTLSDTERQILRANTQGSNSRKVRFYLRNVVDGDIYFSWKEVNYTVINAYPTIGISVVDANTNTIALTGDNTKLVKYHSTAVANITAAAYKEAYITEHFIEYGGTRYTEETKVFENVESNDFTFIAIDSRNNVESEYLQPELIEYIKPTVNIDNSGTMDTDGNYTIKCGGNYFNNTFGDSEAAALNMLSVQYRYKEQGGTYSEWAIMTVSVPGGNNYTAEKAISGLDYRKAYTFQCKAVDKLNTIVSAEITVKSLPVFHWSETDFVFEVPVIFNAGAEGIESGGTTDNNNVEGDLTVSGDINLGGNLYIDGEPLTIPENNATYGTWKPTLTTAAAVNSYTVQQGWYQKVGNVVSIGWQIKADVKSGYNSYSIGISGCPFTPTYAAFGGGVAHNIAFIAQYNFEGWALGTDGIITPRGQPCNTTTMVNLNITSTAYYPTGSSGSTMTLAGSMCFITN